MMRFPPAYYFRQTGDFLQQKKKKPQIDADNKTLKSALIRR